MRRRRRRVKRSESEDGKVIKRRDVRWMGIARKGESRGREVGGVGGRRRRGWRRHVRRRRERL